MKKILEKLKSFWKGFTSIFTLATIIIGFVGLTIFFIITGKKPKDSLKNEFERKLDKLKKERKKNEENILNRTNDDYNDDGTPK